MLKQYSQESKHKPYTVALTLCYSLGIDSTNRKQTMRVIKTYSKQIELAEKGLLFCIVNCAYVRVSSEHVKIAKETNQSVKFYAKAW